MSMRERQTRVRLDGLLSDGQLKIVRELVLSQLIGSAGDLRLLNRLPDPRRAVREVAALGRLAFWLGYREILVPDQIAREVMSRLATEVDGMNEQGDTTGGDPPAEHEALWAFVGLFTDWPTAAEVQNHFSAQQSPAESTSAGGCDE